MERQKKSKHFLHQPQYPGGPKAMSQFIYAQLKYPKEALESGTEGVVLVEISINHKGEVFDTRILNSVGQGCDEEAARICRLLKFEVNKNRGVKASFFQKIKVQFKKPAQQAVQPNMQVQYNITPAAPVANEASKTESNTYTYTFTING